MRSNEVDAQLATSIRSESHGRLFWIFMWMAVLGMELYVIAGENIAFMGIIQDPYFLKSLALDFTAIAYNLFKYVALRQCLAHVNLGATMFTNRDLMDQKAFIVDNKLFAHEFTIKKTS